MTIGSLFSGIGGLELGLERAGLGPVLWQAECDPYCLKVLKKHWPNVKRYTDVKDINEGAERPDIICGGFPCQDISNAGKREGIEGSRSGLWSEFARIVRLLRPQIVVVENVTALLSRGMSRVLGDLATIGYDAQWDCIPAAAIGATHRRDRVFIVAYTKGKGLEGIWKGLSRYSSWWTVEPDVGRVANGISHRVDRLRGLGNAVVPQVAEYIGQQIKGAA
jgi:DNA (cytosine-5)-methyltransferase 1